MSQQYVYSMLRVSKVVPPQKIIIKDISLSFFPGAKIGLLGLNGAGKSTVLRIMAGVDKEFEGEAVPMGGIKIGYLPQEPELDPEKTVREEVESGLGEVAAAQKRLEEVYAEYANPDADFDALAEEQGRLEAIIAAGSSTGGGAEHELEIAADALRLPEWDAKIGNLSGGEKRRVALCKLLLSKPDMLLLDEPTNHLDAESVEWLEQFLVRFPGTVVAVTHDRYFLDNAAEWILELDRGHGIPWKGNYSSWLEQKEKRLENEAKSEAARVKAMKQELEWVRQNAKGRQAKSKARLARFEEMSNYEYQKRNETQEIFIPVAERLGNEVIEFVNVSKSFGDKVLIDDLSFKVPAGAIVGIIGPNGAGKSTVLRIMAGVDKEFESEAVPMGGIKIGYLPQEPELDPEKTVREEVESGLGEVAAAQKRLEEVYAEYANPDADFDALAEEQGRLEAIIAAGSSTGGGAEHELEIAADALRLPEWDAKIGNLSGGEKRRVALCKLLLSKPDMLLLDEPTNHLDAESVEWLEQFLVRFPGTVVAVTHDRYFLDNAAEWILELDRGHGIPWKGNYSSWLEQKEKRLENEAKSEAARVKAMKQELEWVRQNAKGRQAKSKARLARFEEMSNYEYQKRNETQEIFIPVAERLGNEVIEFVNVSKSFGDKVLIDDLSFKVPAGAIVGIIGPNGAGKSTLFKMISGKEQPDSGEVKIGQTVKMSLIDQSREGLQNDKTVFDNIAEGRDILQVGQFEIPARQYLGRFNFKGSDQSKIAGQLSGGERGRLHLAKTLLSGGNVLLLDEPSNDLDVETLRALEDALLEFAGSVMVISHDRWFLDRIATHILACEGDSKWVFFDGNYQEYEADKKRRLGEEGAKPKRIRYKPVTR